MKEEIKFYLCKHCGNIIGVVHDSGARVVCCGDPMTPLTPNTSDGAQEKHVPVITVDGKKVHIAVGSAPHPMIEAHHIAWVYIETEKGGQRKNLVVDSAPEVDFMLTDDDKLVAAYAYCNLHGLWKAEA